MTNQTPDKTENTKTETPVHPYFKRLLILQAKGNTSLLMESQDKQVPLMINPTYEEDGELSPLLWPTAQMSSDVVVLTHQNKNQVFGALIQGERIIAPVSLALKKHPQKEHGSIIFDRCNTSLEWNCNTFSIDPEIKVTVEAKQSQITAEKDQLQSELKKIEAKELSADTNSNIDNDKKNEKLDDEDIKANAEVALEMCDPDTELEEEAETQNKVIQSRIQSLTDSLNQMYKWPENVKATIESFKTKMKAKFQKIINTEDHLSCHLKIKEANQGQALSIFIYKPEALVTFLNGVDINSGDIQLAEADIWIFLGLTDSALLEQEWFKNLLLKHHPMFIFSNWSSDEDTVCEKIETLNDFLQEQSEQSLCIEFFSTYQEEDNFTQQLHELTILPLQQVAEEDQKYIYTIKPLPSSIKSQSR